MRPEFGNAAVCALPARGWIVGHFVKESSLRSTDGIEIKWGMHQPGGFSDWKSQAGKKAITILLSGKFHMQIRSGRKTEVFTLKSSGDFVIWENKQKHRWKALDETIIMTVRWPSVVKVS